MGIHANELTHALLKELQGIEIGIEEVGEVLTVGDGIVTTDGLNTVTAGELLLFESGTAGMALNLNEETVGIILLAEDETIKEGTTVRRTGKIVSVPAGDALLGRVVNPLGEPIDGLEPIVTTKTHPIERVASGVMSRQSVTVPLQTGIKAIDAIVPIGRGQRELIIGDRQTGKTSIALDTIINQKGKDVLCVYVSIGQKNSSVNSIYNALQKVGAMEYTVIVSAGVSELSPIQYIAPYAGCAMAEEWMEQGKDVLIVYDDLSKHAVAYRTISLLLHRPPGREAYPGDVFYLHSRLLERAANLNDANGGGSITALPIVETQAGDISSYIPTNVISITDGQIFLQTDLFMAGQRPAISTGLSVSRVGGNAQTNIIKKLSGTLKVELAQFYELQAFSQFGSSVDDHTRLILNHGKKVEALLRQPNNHPLSMAEEAFILFAIKERYIDRITEEKMDVFEKKLLQYINTHAQELIAEITNHPVYTPEIAAKMKTILDNFMLQTYAIHTTTLFETEGTDVHGENRGN